MADVAAFLEDTPHALATVGGDAFESPQTAALLSQMSKLTLARNVDDKAFCAVELTNGDTFEQGEGDFSGEEQILAKITGSTLASDRKDLEKDIEVSMKRLTYYLLYSRAP